MSRLPFHRVLRRGTVGYDVWAAKRAVYRLLGGWKWLRFLAQTNTSKRTMGPAFVKDVGLIQNQLTAGRTQGAFDESTLRAVEDAGGFDATARALWLKQYPPAPVYVQPKQGFSSLVEDLWGYYTAGRNMGLTDLGTYNPGSTLPSSGAPSDHATSRVDGRIGEPACAFDLGFTPQIGFGNPLAQRFFNLMVGRPGIHYVICGDKIWSAERGLHQYSDSTSHAGHVHVSGYRR